jgi:lipoprotein signal peptidase
VRGLDTLKLERFPHRAFLMTSAALVAFALDFFTKTIAVAAAPRTLLFHVSSQEPFGLGASLIFVAAATSLMACVLPPRPVSVGAGVALGGGLGNLVSRSWWSERGGSPDFIPLADGSTANVADFFIAIGLATTLVGSVVWLGWTIAVRHT